MKIRLLGNTSKVSGSELRYATRFMSDLIMNRQLTKNLDLTIKFIGNEKESDSFGRYILYGNCEWLDENRSPRKFRINLNKSLGRRKLLLTLAHELIHVKQYAKNELVDAFRGPTNVKWKREFVDEETMFHADLPWEVEAKGREEGMYDRYIIHIRTTKKKFI
jgi:hypothetical protein